MNISAFGPLLAGKGVLAFLALAVAFISSSDAHAGECGIYEPEPVFSEAMLGPDTRRVAFILANSDYSNVGKLKNPGNDAELLSRKLVDLGFRTTVGQDLDQAEFERCFADFEEATVGAQVAFFHYSGHAIQIEERNYLLPVDAPVDADPRPVSVDIDRVIRALQLAQQAVLTLDGCRTNPMVANPVRLASRGIGTIRAGLAPVGGEQGTLGSNLFIAYATSPNQIADDGAGEFSPFTAALAQEIGFPGRTVQDAMITVSRRVAEATEYMQTPWTRSSMIEPLYLNGTFSVSEIVERSTLSSYVWDENLKGLSLEERLYRALLSVPIGIEMDDFRFEKAITRLRTLVSLDFQFPDSLGAGEYLFADDRSRLLSGWLEYGQAAEQDLVLWNMRTGQKIATLLPQTQNFIGGAKPVFSSTAQYVAATDIDRNVIVWSANNGEKLRTLPWPCQEEDSRSYRAYRDKDWPRLSFSASSHQLIMECRKSATILDIRAGTVQHIESGSVQAKDGSPLVVMYRSWIQRNGKDFAFARSRLSETMEAGFIMDGVFYPLVSGLPVKRNPSVTRVSDEQFLIATEARPTSMRDQVSIGSTHQYRMIDITEERAVAGPEFRGSLAGSSFENGRLYVNGIFDNEASVKAFDFETGNALSRPLDRAFLQLDQFIPFGSKTVESQLESPAYWIELLPLNRVEDLALARLSSEQRSRLPEARLKLFQR